MPTRGQAADTRSVRVALRIPDSVFGAADRIAKRLNAVYTGEAEKPDPFVAEAARRTLRRNDW